MRFAIEFDLPVRKGNTLSLAYHHTLEGEAGRQDRVLLRGDHVRYEFVPCNRSPAAVKRLRGLCRDAAASVVDGALHTRQLIDGRWQTVRYGGHRPERKGFLQRLFGGTG